MADLGPKAFGELSLPLALGGSGAGESSSNTGLDPFAGCWTGLLRSTTLVKTFFGGRESRRDSPGQFFVFA